MSGTPSSAPDLGNPMDDMPIAHLAGPVIEYNHEDGTVIHQRCSWCGVMLEDLNLSRVMVREGDPAPGGGWPTGQFIDVDKPDGPDSGGVMSVVDWTHPNPVPANACLRLPLEVTR